MQWQQRSCDAEVVSALAESAKLPHAVAQLLVQRGITTAEAAQRFLAPELSHLHDPYAMLGMKVAVERLQHAIAAKEPLLIYGDYDVDGTTAVVILKTCVELLGGVADFHVPHRIREGYGMRDDVLENAAAAGIKLVISVDTGIRAFAAAETARRLTARSHRHRPSPAGSQRAASARASSAQSQPAGLQISLQRTMRRGRCVQDRPSAAHGCRTAIRAARSHRSSRWRQSRPSRIQFHWSARIAS